MTAVRVRDWGFNYSEARFYGWRHSVHIGPWLIFWGRMSAQELRAALDAKDSER